MRVLKMNGFLSYALHVGHINVPLVDISFFDGYVTNVEQGRDNIGLQVFTNNLPLNQNLDVKLRSQLRFNSIPLNPESFNHPVTVADYRMQRVSDGHYITGYIHASQQVISNMTVYRLTITFRDVNQSNDPPNGSTNYATYGGHLIDYGGTRWDGLDIGSYGWLAVEYQGKTYAGFCIYGSNYTGGVCSLRALYDESFWNAWGVTYGDIYDDSFGPPSEPGGYGGGPGSFDDTSDRIGLPPIPALSVSNLGYLNTYKVTPTGLAGMVDELFPHLDNPVFPEPAGDGTLADIQKAMNAVGNALINFSVNFANSNLLQYVVDVHVIPVNPAGGQPENIRCGYRTLTPTAVRVFSDYVDYDCGSIAVSEYYENFVDYFTKAQLFLPFVGFVPLQPEIFIGRLHVVYRFNIIDGSFNAFILATSPKSPLQEDVVGVYSGNCCVHVPITSSDYASIVSGLVQGVSNATQLVQTKEINADTGEEQTVLKESVDAIKAGYNSIATITSKPMYQLSNGYNATSSFAGMRTPFLQIQRPKASFSDALPKESGLPLNVTKKLSDVHGFTICENPHIDGIECSDKERTLIYNLLTSGIIL